MGFPSRTWTAPPSRNWCVNLHRPPHSHRQDARSLYRRRSEMTGTMTMTRQKRTRRKCGRTRECHHLVCSKHHHRQYSSSNQRAPMPELVMSGSSTSGSSAVSPPPAAFQPVLRILKRPTATTSSSASSVTSTSSSDPSSNSFADREARYQAARDRIFRESGSTSGSPNATMTGASQTSPLLVQIARDPKGPPPQDGPASASGRGQGGDSRGFGHRRGKRRGGHKP